ncbi:MAG: BatD family protein [Bacteroidota bacterium]
MKYLIFFSLLLISVSSYSQTLKLDLSLPQPRLGQSFYITFSSDTISKQIFNLPQGKFKINNYSNSTSTETSFSVNIEALKTGENELGPLTFTFNGNTYKTDVIKFMVADSLPRVDKGVWIRKVPIDDTSVYIIIDQRIPTHPTITQKDKNTISMSAEVNNDEKETTLKIEDVENAKIEERYTSSETVPNFFGDKLSYGLYYKCYRVTLLDKKKPLVLTSAAFENLPGYYKFQSIKIN